ncbi:MAG: tRNA (N6-threonylcarbamoyladenosine(37)-N6)-methyltransferase TrmO [Chloroflexi bacterium]|nr:tRNA (N6-threonylcarbamoyladenosine(37)-N6)-methyltransferase TrmO [Chloroflexota bacterium]
MLDRLRKLLAGAPPEPGPLSPVTIGPIGRVRNRVKKTRPRGWESVTSEVVLKPELAEALLGLSDYSHLIVLTWLHAIPEDVRGSKLRLHPMDKPEYPLQGVLATRSQIRPNPIGCTVVQLLGIKGNVLKVRGLDAIDGTPVLDLKPYLPFYDGVADARVPEWVAGLRGGIRSKWGG